MRFKYSLVAVCVLTTLVLSQNLRQSTSNTPLQNNLATSEKQFEIRRQNFASGRQILLDKGVPFDPDDLLRDGWAKNLKPNLDAMPEMHESRYEKAPLNGAYFADTLYLPEQVEVSGHIVILANYVVFEGKNPVIKGNYDIHFFPAKPVAVLGASLAEALHKKTGVINVKLGSKFSLPSFALIKGIADSAKHTITIDSSGRPPQAALHPSPRPTNQFQNSSGIEFKLLKSSLQSSINCPSSCDNSGEPGTTGAPGFSPPQAATGNPNGGPQAPSGTCGPPVILNGSHGGTGGAGSPGTIAGDGGRGLPGFNAGTINATIADGDLNQYTFRANGGAGGQGGPGGEGGQGGDGGAGTAGGNGVACGCSVGSGGNGGQGGTAGIGGHGGNGGQGGNGGSGGVITVSLPFGSPGANTFFARGSPGRSGDPGAPGLPGNPGVGGIPGTGGLATSCNASGANGAFLGGGASAGSSGPGNPGDIGQSGPAGSQNVVIRPNPGGGVGGGGCAQEDCSECPPGGDNPFFTSGGCTSPIIIDVEGEGFHLTSAFTGVTFDISGTGNPVQIAWTDAHFHNAFLALPGPDGLVHNGKQLFGNFTAQPQSAHPNGFLALAQYDKTENGGNSDGIIDDKDTIFSQLRLWIDDNHDGICQPEELHRLQEFGIYSLSVNFVESRRKDEFGNSFRYKARVNPGERKDPRDQTLSGDPGRWAYDVFFVTK